MSLFVDWLFVEQCAGNQFLKKKVIRFDMKVDLDRAANIAKMFKSGVLGSFPVSFLKTGTAKVYPLQE